jgi:hypothetical protein
VSGDKLPFSTLWDLLEYIQNGPERILLRRPESERRFVAYYQGLRLAEYTLGARTDKSYHSIALYLPAPEAIPAVEAPLLRRTTGKIPTRARYARQRRSWPNVRTTIHRLPDQVFEAVSSAVLNLDRALQAMPAIDSGVDFDVYYREPVFDPTTPTVDVTGSYFRLVKRGHFDAGFIEASDELRLGEPWSVLWQLLHAICDRSPPTRRFRDAYNLSPESYLVALQRQHTFWSSPLR